MVKDNFDEEIFNLRKKGTTYQKIADQLGVSLAFAYTRYKKVCSFKKKENPEIEIKIDINISEEEKRIYQLKEKGKTYKEISEELEIPYKKVRYLYIKVCKKLGRDIKNEKEELLNKIYELSKEGMNKEEIAQTLNMDEEALYRICKKIYEEKGEKIPESLKKYRKKQLSERDLEIFRLREDGLIYDEIAKKLKISRQRVDQKCKQIYAKLEMEEPNKRKVKELEEKIYELREEGLSREEIALKLGVTLSYVKLKYSAIYKQKGLETPEDRRKKELDEKIFKLRESGLTRGQIAKELNLALTTIDTKCPRIYREKGKEEPLVKRGIKAKTDLDYLDEEIFQLREQKKTHKEIAEELRLTRETVRKKCKKIYHIKGKEQPTLSSLKTELDDIDNKIYEMIEQGFSYLKIANEVNRSQTVVIKRAKRIYRLKNEENPKTRKKGLSEKIYAMRIKEMSYSEILLELEKDGDILTKEQASKRYCRLKNINKKIAQGLLNLMITRKATLDQIKIMAEYYGVDLEEIFSSLKLEER